MAYTPPPQANGSGYAPNATNTPVFTTMAPRNEGALIVEVLLSLFGIFGVGWLMAGETTVGSLLLTCSFVVYWPIMLLGTLFTFGIGLICLGPLTIAAIIVNALLLNRALTSKPVHYVVMPPPPMPLPPQ